jgi:DNA-binding beta-propeller fold protein YncE
MALAPPSPTTQSPVLRSLCALIVFSALAAAPTSALGASRPPAVGTLTQLGGTSGCLVDRAKPITGCAAVRALRGPAPFLGSQAVAISRDGKNVYVASSRSNAIAAFRRSTKSGKLTQRPGTAGCISDGGIEGCAPAVALKGPNSVAVSADGKSVYATSLVSNAVVVLSRNTTTGALTQATDGTGCIANATTTGCTTGRALSGPDVVSVAPDGENVYVGAFKGNAVAVFTRNTTTGSLTQPAGTTGCIVNTPTTGCATGIALAAPEGMATSADGENVYVAAATGNAVLTFTRDASTGALTQPTDGTGCISNAARTGCTTGRQLAGANAVAISRNDGSVYVTSLLSNSVTSFSRSTTTGQLQQLPGTTGCVVFVLAVGCSLGHALSAPEGLAVSSDGASVYATAFTSGALDVFDRDADAGGLMQRSGRPGCFAARTTPNCTLGRALAQVSSAVVSADGKNVYTGAFSSNAVGVFKRTTGP